MSTEALIQLSENLDAIDGFAVRVFNGEGAFWWYRLSDNTFHPSELREAPPMEGDEYLLAVTPGMVADYQTPDQLADMLTAALIRQMDRPVA